jgi:hypothetical protein
MEGKFSQNNLSYNPAYQTNISNMSISFSNEAINYYEPYRRETNSGIYYLNFTPK